MDGDQGQLRTSGLDQRLLKKPFKVTVWSRVAKKLQSTTIFFVISADSNKTANPVRGPGFGSFQLQQQSDLKTEHNFENSIFDFSKYSNNFCKAGNV